MIKSKSLVIRMLLLLVAAALAGLAVLWTPRLSAVLERHYHHGLRVVTLTSGLATPWSLGFLPDGRMLLTEREGRLRLIPQRGGNGQVVSGLPPIWAEGEGGLFTVLVDPGFSGNHLIYWNYVEPTGTGQPGGGIAVARGRLEGAAVTDINVIFRDPDKSAIAGSFGSRMTFAGDGGLFITVGDRGRRDDAQNLGSLHGKILHVNLDGSVPGDNPFVHVPGANPLIWALGFRDPQGITVDPVTGQVWASDHGPAGGDEINLIQPGHNYGWPVISYGVDEGTGRPIGEGTSKPGMDQPVVWWGRTAKGAVPPTGMTVLTSGRYPQWQGNLFVGTLWGQSMMRLEVRGTQVVGQQRLFTNPYERIRDVKQGPDGWLYLVANRPDGCLIRLER
jgi:aldose sugar dehydrogenase